MTVEIPQYAVQDEVRVNPARTALVVIDMQNDFVARMRGSQRRFSSARFRGTPLLLRGRRSSLGGNKPGLGDCPFRLAAEVLDRWS